MSQIQNAIQVRDEQLVAFERKESTGAAGIQAYQPSFVFQDTAFDASLQTIDLPESASNGTEASFAIVLLINILFSHAVLGSIKSERVATLDGAIPSFDGRLWGCVDPLGVVWIREAAGQKEVCSVVKYTGDRNSWKQEF